MEHISHPPSRRVLAPPILNLYDNEGVSTASLPLPPPLPPAPVVLVSARTPTDAEGDIAPNAAPRGPPFRLSNRSAMPRHTVPSAPRTRGPNSGQWAHTSEAASATPPPTGEWRTQPPQPQEEGTHERRHRVVQSAYSQRNPFRRQTLEEFRYAPDCSAPPDFVLPEDHVSAWSRCERVAEGNYRIQHDVNAAHKRMSAAAMYDAAGPALTALQSGDWFLKWTRGGRVHERYFWLDIHRGLLLWGRTPRPTLVMLSQIAVTDIMDVRPDCVVDEQSQRRFYRMHIITEDRTYMFATEVQEKFDVWFDAMRRITSANERKGSFGQLWPTPSESVEASTTAKWVNRYSPLHSIWKGNGTGVEPTSRDNVALYGGSRGYVLPSD